MSKNLKVVLGIIFVFVAIIYTINIAAKSFEDANSIGSLISHLVIGVLVGGVVAFGLLGAEEQKNNAVNYWISEKLDNHFNVLFLIGIVSILSIAISKSVHEATKSSWYLANEISNNGITICDKYESSIQVEKSYDKLIKLSQHHYSSDEIFLMACTAAINKTKDSESYALKVALTSIAQKSPSSAKDLVTLIKDADNQEKLFNQFMKYGYLEDAEFVIETIKKKDKKQWLMYTLANNHLERKNYNKAEALFSFLFEKSAYINGFYGLTRVYNQTNRAEKSVEMLLKFLKFSNDNELDTFETHAHLAYYYDNGRGVERNLISAREHYEKGFLGLSDTNISRLAEMYYKGIGGPVDKKRALELGFQTDEMKLASKIKKYKKRSIDRLDKPNSDYYEYSEDKKLRMLYGLFKRRTGALNLCSNVSYERIGIMKETISDPYQNGGKWTTYVSSISYDCYSPQLGDQDMDWIFTATCDSRSNTCTCIQGKGVEFAASVIENARYCTKENITL